MRTLLNLLAVTVAVVCFSPSARGAHTQASLILSAQTARPGDSIIAGIHFRMDPEWHTYWRNSGASGLPTTIDWNLPAGVTAGEIQWPVPAKLPPDELVTYIYEHEVVLLVPLQLAADLKPGPLSLKANVSWLECKELCLPGNAELEGSIVVSNSFQPSPDAPLIETWQKRLPQEGKDRNPRISWERPASEKVRPVIIEWTSGSPASAPVSEADFYPFANDAFEVQGSVERLRSDPGTLRIRKMVRRLGPDWPAQIQGLLIEKSDDSKVGYEVSLSFATGASDSSDAAISGPAQSIGTMLLYAFLGGLILNIMPCVLPVIALKILGFVSESRSEPAKIRKLGLVYGAGVLTSFLVLAALVIAVKAAGNQAGWGMQFANPHFLIGLTILVTLVALNLFGIFEVNLGSRVMGGAGSLASKQGPAGAFFNGILATVLATPCTAPFLGTALGFAFLQPSRIILLILLTVGLGLAFPYVLLSFKPEWLRFLPKPGAWMERFKIAMGFPMLATAIWLFSLTQTHYGKRTWWLAMFLVFLGLAAWVFGEFVQRGRARRPVAAVIAIVLLGIGYGYALETQLNWRHPVKDESSTATLQTTPDGIPWQPWSAEAVTRAQAENRPVLVDFTADWCLTCQANKKFALEIPSVRAKLKEINAVSLLGDYTRLPPVMTRELNRHGRAGVPLVLVFPGQPGAAPEILPEALTPGIVLNALERARQKNP